MSKLLVAIFTLMLPAVGIAGSVDVKCFDGAQPSNAVAVTGAARYEMVGGTLTIFAKDGTPVYYRVPENYICAVKENYEEDGTEPRVRNYVHPEASWSGR